MAIKKRLAFLFRRSVVTSLALAALAFVAGAPFGAPALKAQGPPDLEVQHRRLLPLFELAGVVFTDADETRGRLVVGVLDRDIEGLIRARLAVLGIAAQSVDVVETEAIFPVDTLRDKVRPVVGGLQIRFSGYLCSLGFNAIRAGIAGFVTASHCSDKQGSVDGTKYYQPLNQVADEFIGTEIADPAYKRNIAGCPRGRVCRRSDANFSDGDDSVLFTLGAIAKTTGPNNGSLVIDGEFAISAEGSANVGDTANKVGRTTGWSQGAVTNTCANTGVSGTNIVLLCQDFVEKKNVQIVAGGDSGSPVFRIDGGNNVTLLGGLWGGNSSGTLFVYSPIANIEVELGDLDTF
jgi:V8-like Glu-specific endopeptidase